MGWGGGFDPLSHLYYISKRQAKGWCMVKLSELTESLRIDKYNLDEEMVHQPSLFWQVAEAAAISRSRLDQAEAELKEKEAELDNALRLEAEEKGEKCTESSIAMAIKRHPDRVEAHRNYLGHKLGTEKLDQLRESFKQRNYVLGDLAGLHVSGYFQSSSATRTQTLERAKDLKAEYNRERMTKRRRLR